MTVETRSILFIAMFFVTMAALGFTLKWAGNLYLDHLDRQFAECAKTKPPALCRNR